MIVPLRSRGLSYVWFDVNDAVGDGSTGMIVMMMVMVMVMVMMMMMLKP